MMFDPTRKALLRRLADGEFHSGSALARESGLTRAAIWKQVRELESLGLAVAAVPGRGYRLEQALELLDLGTIRAGLTAEASALLAGLTLDDAIDSTNSHLLRLAGEGAATGSVSLAESQSAGRGRIGRQWVSPYGASVYLSILWRYPEPSRVAGLSLAAGAVVARVLTALGYEGIGLKWPNDILAGDAKLGGILLEVSGEAHGRCVVVLGLGLNVRLPQRVGAAIDQPWTDLWRTPGRGRVGCGRNQLVAALLNALLPALVAFGATGLASWLPEWRTYHRLQGRLAVVRQGDVEFLGRIVDVSSAGLLCFECEDGSQRQFASGDVTLRAKVGM